MTNDNNNPQDMQTILERLWADPDNLPTDMIKAAALSPGQHQECLEQGQQAKAFNQKLSNSLHEVKAPDSLLGALLAIPEQAANDGTFLRRLLPVAAMLLLAISVGLFYHPDLNANLAQDVFGHIYFEEPFFGDGSTISTEEVNARISVVFGAQQTSGNQGEVMQVTFAKDCLIAKQKAMHLVIKGETGPINVMMIPSHVVDNEVRITDQRFNGLVTPASGGTLVVVGNKREHIDEYRDRFAHSLDWEY